MVTKCFELVFRGSIETKSVNPRQTAENNPAYKVYLINEIKCLGHENELRNLSHIYIHTYKYKVYIYIYICINCYLKLLSGF